ncbi:Tyrosine recombinase XerC [subsurface metagenome]
MSKSKKNYPWLTNKPNSAKTIIERAKREVPGFIGHYKKFEEQMTIGGYSSSALFFAPARLKQRVLFALIYSAGLRIGEVCNLKISDIDSDRMQIRVVKSKGNHDRYVVLSHYILQGLRKYIKSSKPKVYLLNGKVKGEPLGKSAVQQSFRLAVKKASPVTFSFLLFLNEI